MYRRTNGFIFTGTIEKIIFENDKVVKFTIIEDYDKKMIRLDFATFDAELMKVVINAIGKKVTVKGVSYNTNYKDKNGNWVNTVTHQVNALEVED